MEYSNPEIPEGINTTREHPLKEFTILLGGILAVIIAIIIILSLAAEKLAVYIPFSVEQKLVAEQSTSAIDTHPEVTRYLQQLADKLSSDMDLPTEMTISVHYLDQDIDNAYATLGGQVYIYRGLITQLRSENALSMIIAHEIAHIKFRHPLIAMGRGVVVGLFLATLAGVSGDNVVGSIVNDTGVITLLSFNRKQERAADAAALEAVDKYYGHVGGSEDLFRTLLALESKNPVHPPEFLSTHPLNENRIDNIDELAKKNNWPITGNLTAIPQDILEIVRYPDK